MQNKIYTSISQLLIIASSLIMANALCAGLLESVSFDDAVERSFFQVVALIAVAVIGDKS